MEEIVEAGTVVPEEIVEAGTVVPAANQSDVIIDVEEQLVLPPSGTIDEPPYLTELKAELKVLGESLLSKGSTDTGGNLKKITCGIVFIIGCGLYIAAWAYSGDWKKGLPFLAAVTLSVMTLLNIVWK